MWVGVARVDVGDPDTAIGQSKIAGVYGDHASARELTTEEHHTFDGFDVAPFLVVSAVLERLWVWVTWRRFAGEKWELAKQLVHDVRASAAVRLEAFEVLKHLAGRLLGWHVVFCCFFGESVREKVWRCR